MRIALLILFCLISVAASAQDVIVRRNGDEIQARVLAVSDSGIDYKKWSNQDGPTYTLSRDDVFMIKYINGDKDVFGDESRPVVQKETSSPGYVAKAPASNNAELIRKYRPEMRVKTEPSEKPSKWFFPVMAVADSSVLSNEDIEIAIVPHVVCYDGTISLLRYYIEIENKTGNTIYVDKANTFRIDTDGSYSSYFDTNQINITEGSSSGVGINLGGITNVLGIGGVAGTLANATSVGGMSQNSVTKSYSQQRILMIPPRAKTNLSEYKQVHVKGSHYENISEAESWGEGLVSPRPVKKGECVYYDEQESPYENRYFITYSTRADFSSYSILGFRIYARCIIGERYFSPYNEVQFIKGIQKYLPDFLNNPHLIVGDCIDVGKP